MDGRKPLTSVNLYFADGTYLFRFRSRHIAELQEKRGFAVTWPDGSTGKRPKPLGMIWREHTTGDYDPLDSEEIIRLGLIAGAGGVVNEEPVTVTPTSALLLCQRTFDDMPQEDKWQLATAILVATCQGFIPPEADAPADGEPGGEQDPGNADGAGTTV
jgi:hypothetical protein